MLIKKILIFFSSTILLSCVCSTEDYKDTQVDTIKITFDGAKKEYVGKYGLSIDITDENVIDQIKILVNQSKSTSVFRSLRPVMHRTSVFFINNEENTKAFEINVNTENIVTIIIDDCYYVNEELYRYIAALIMLEEIKNYNGSMNQERYELEIIVPNNM